MQKQLSTNWACRGHQTHRSLRSMFTKTIKKYKIDCKAMQNFQNKWPSYWSWWGRLIAAFAEWTCAIRFERKPTNKDNDDSQEQQPSNYGYDGCSIPCGRWEGFFFITFSLSLSLSLSLSRLIRTDLLVFKQQIFSVYDKPHSPEWKLKPRKQLLKSQPWFQRDYLMENNSMRDL